MFSSFLQERLDWPGSVARSAEQTGGSGTKKSSHIPRVRFVTVPLADWLNPAAQMASEWLWQ